jgi:hypothetical protein
MIMSALTRLLGRRQPNGGDGGAQNSSCEKSHLQPRFGGVHLSALEARSSY